MLTAPEVAAFCNVDVRTVHNWTERGALSVHKTPGGHRRFSPIVVVQFLRAHGYPIARALRDRKPEVLLCIESGPVVDLARKSLGKRFSLTVYPTLMHALWFHDMPTAEALVVDPSEHVEFLMQVEPKVYALAPHIQRVHFTRTAVEPGENPVPAHMVAHASPGLLRAALEESLGLR